MYDHANDEESTDLPGSVADRDLSREGGSDLQVQYTGPGGIDYINPADDPRKVR
jgi:hypothetical protein